MRPSLYLSLLSVAGGVLGVGPAQALAASPQCGATIVRSTTLTADVGPCPATGLVIGRDGISLNLNGHTISGTTTGLTSGVDLNGHSGVTVRNGTISSFVRAVNLGRTAGVTVSWERIVDLTFVNNEFAIDGNADHTLVAYNTSAYTHPPGQLFGGDLQIDGGSDTAIHNTALNDNLSVAGHDDRTAYNRVNFLAVAPDTLGGDVDAHNVTQTLDVYGAPNTTRPSALITRNKIVPKGPGVVYGPGGIYLEGSSHVLVTHNTITGVPGNAPDVGILVFSFEPNMVATGNFIANNRISGAIDQGILIQGQFMEILPSPPCTANCVISYTESTNTILWRNVTTDNGHDYASTPDQDGIYNTSPTTTFLGNVANNNLDLGVESVPSVTDLGGDRASGNGDPRQCLNVVCH